MLSTPISLLYAALNAFLFATLSIWVVKLRWQHKVEIGHVEGGTLHRMIRVHANAAEYIPIVLLLLLILELNHAAPWLLHSIGAGLLLGRILHAYGLYSGKGPNPGRFLGTILTWAALLAGAIGSLCLFLQKT